MVKVCAVPRCESGSRNERREREKKGLRQTALFKAPKCSQKLLKWSESLGLVLRQTQYVCELHFKDTEILKVYETKLPNGEVHIIPRRWSLAPHATPDIQVKESKMVRKCIICGLTYSAESGISLHSFPTNEKFKKLWLKACNMTDVSKQTKICSNHFDASCFKTYDDTGFRILEKNAVPVLFSDEEDRKRLQKHPLSSSIVQSVSSSTSYTENTTEFQNTVENLMEVQDEIQTQIKSGKSSSVTEEIPCPVRIEDCKEECFSTPRCAKHCFDLVIRELSESKKRMDASRKQMIRLKSKIQTFEDFIRKLQDEQLISEKATEILLVHTSRMFNI